MNVHYNFTQEMNNIEFASDYARFFSVYITMCFNIF